MMTPPLSIWARPRLAVQVPVSGEWPLVVGDVGAMGSTVMAAAAPGVRANYPYISRVCTDVRLKRIRHRPKEGRTTLRVTFGPWAGRGSSAVSPVPRAPCRSGGWLD